MVQPLEATQTPFNPEKSFLALLPLTMKRELGDLREVIEYTIFEKIGIKAPEHGGLDKKPPYRISLHEYGPHENSDSHYVFQAELDGDWFGAYILLPEETTSAHKHPSGIREDYFFLKGSLTQIVDGVLYPVRASADKFTINPGQRHYSATEKDQYAAILVRMVGAAGLASEEQHHDSRKPVTVFERSTSRDDHAFQLLKLYHYAYE